MSVCSVLAPLPFDKCFDYLIPEGMEVEAGDYVRIPFGTREIYGVVWAASVSLTDTKKLKTIQAKVEHIPSMPLPLRQVIDWTAGYTLASKGSVLKMALSVPEALHPPSLRKGAGRRVRKADSESSCTPHSAHRTLSLLQQQAASVLIAKLSEGFSVNVLDGVTGSGKTEVYFEAIERVLRAESGEQCKKSTAPRTLHPAPQTLVLLPEIALSVQWLKRFQERFGDVAHLWHSGVTPAHKRETWRAIATGKARLVVGARSALFLPFRNLQFMVVDEEHEHSYKQEDGVIYQARDIAVIRAQKENIPLVLVSATPSLETVVNIEQGKYHALHLPSRHGGAELPEVSLIDMRRHRPPAERWISEPLEKSLRDTLTAGHQAMLFINRRGFAPLVICRSCGHRFGCPHCSAWLVYHGSENITPPKESGINQQDLFAIPNAFHELGIPAQGAARSVEFGVQSPQRTKCNEYTPSKTRRISRLQCHHCDYRTPLPSHCPECGALAEDALYAFGPGVERIAEEARKLFPEARIGLMTSDALPTEAATRKLIEEVESGAINLLVGTQMMAKGHHFPNLALVGVVDADAGLAGGDLRAAERSWQLLHQLSGRAGREKIEGKVLLQTYNPDHAVMQALLHADRDNFIAAEKYAREQAGMPPFGRLVALILEGKEEAEVQQSCRLIARHFPAYRGTVLLGPAPAPLAILRGKFRYRLLLKTPREVNTSRLLREWLTPLSLPRNIRLKVDVDPYSFM